VQEQGRAGSGYADIGLAVSEASVLPATRRLIGALRRGRRWAEGDAGTVLRGLPTLARTAQWQAIRGLKYWPPDAVAELKLWIEQTPRRRNRLELGEGRDALGQPKLRVDWEKGETEERTLRLLAEEADRYWRRHAGALGILEWKENLFRKGSRLVDAAVGQAHPAGSTRMGLDPRESIVDPFLKVHALGNVSVASASVFPSSGSANPTLTVMQLALRAADAIARRLEKGS
jgi:choline dehydrogenase-like flavoprotein